MAKLTPKQKTIFSLVRATARTMQRDEVDIIRVGNRPLVRDARSVIVWIMFNQLEMSNSDVVNLFGFISHGSAYSARKRAELRYTDPIFKEDVSAVLSAMKKTVGRRSMSLDPKDEGDNTPL